MKNLIAACLSFAIFAMVLGVLDARAAEGMSGPTSTEYHSQNSRSISDPDKPHESPQSKARPTKKWLRAKGKGAARHEIVVERADAKRGVLAGYETSNGERLLFRATYLTPRVPYAEVLYFDEETGSVERLFPTADSSRMKGKIKGMVTTREIAMIMQEVPKRGIAAHESKVALARLEKFANSPLAKAAEDGVVALYLALDDSASAPALAALLKPLGAFGMAIQMGSGNQSQRTPLSSLVSPEKLASLAKECSAENCQARGKMFSVNSSGYLDVLGGVQSRRVTKTKASDASITTKLGIGVTQPRELLRYTKPVEGSISQRTQAECASLAESQCFGNCGVGCSPEGTEHFGLPECYAHDFCVCLNDDNHAACMFSVPDGCMTDRGQCASLAEAVGAFTEVFFILAAEFVEEFFGAVFDLIVNVLDAIFDFIGSILDSIFEENCEGNGESEEYC